MLSRVAWCCSVRLVKRFALKLVRPVVFCVALSGSCRPFAECLQGSPHRALGADPFPRLVLTSPFGSRPRRRHCPYVVEAAVGCLASSTRGVRFTAAITHEPPCYVTLRREAPQRPPRGSSVRLSGPQDAAVGSWRSPTPSARAACSPSTSATYREARLGGRPPTSPGRGGPGDHHAVPRSRPRPVRPPDHDIRARRGRLVAARRPGQHERSRFSRPASRSRPYGFGSVVSGVTCIVARGGAASTGGCSG